MGYFITLEGPDGSGKSTQAKKLAEYLSSLGHEVVLTREPGGSDGAEELRQILLSGDKDKWDGISEALLFMAARRDHLRKTIFPALERGAWVVCDRFNDSTRAYQGAGHKTADVDVLYQMISDGKNPDLTLILDVDSETGLARVSGRGMKKDRIELQDISFHKALRQAYLDIAKKESERCVVIDASQDETRVFNDIKQIIQERFDD